MDEWVVVTSATATREEAERIAAALVAEQLAACVQIHAIESWYRWEGEVRHDPEWRLDAKTTRARLADVAARIGALHPYDLPEVIAVPVVGGSAAYLAWVGEEAGVETDAGPDQEPD